MKTGLWLRCADVRSQSRPTADAVPPICRRSSRLSSFPEAFFGSSGQGLGHRVRREALARIRGQRVRVDVLVQDHERGDRLDPALVGQADDRCLRDRGVGVEHVLDLPRRHEHSARVDHVLDAIDDE